jgi:hypothetical protein
LLIFQSMEKTGTFITAIVQIKQPSSSVDLRFKEIMHNQ